MKPLRGKESWRSQGKCQAEFEPQSSSTWGKGELPPNRREMVLLERSSSVRLRGRGQGCGRGLLTRMPPPCSGLGAGHGLLPPRPGVDGQVWTVGHPSPGQGCGCGRTEPQGGTLCLQTSRP